MQIAIFNRSESENLHISKIPVITLTLSNISNRLFTLITDNNTLVNVCICSIVSTACIKWRQPLYIFVFYQLWSCFFRPCIFQSCIFWFCIPVGLLGSFFVLHFAVSTVCFWSSMVSISVFAFTSEPFQPGRFWKGR